VVSTNITIELLQRLQWVEHRAIVGLSLWL